MWKLTGKEKEMVETEIRFMVASSCGWQRRGNWVKMIKGGYSKSSPKHVLYSIMMIDDSTLLCVENH